MKEPANPAAFLTTFADLERSLNEIAETLQDVKTECLDLKKKCAYFSADIRMNLTNVETALLELHLIGRTAEKMNEKLRSACRKNLDLCAKIEEWDV